MTEAEILAGIAALPAGKRRAELAALASAHSGNERDLRPAPRHGATEFATLEAVGLAQVDRHLELGIFSEYRAVKASRP